MPFGHSNSIQLTQIVIWLRRKRSIIQSWRRTSCYAIIWRRNWRVAHADAGRSCVRIRPVRDFDAIRLVPIRAPLRYRRVPLRKFTRNIRRCTSNRNSNKEHKCWRRVHNSATIRDRPERKANPNRITVHQKACDAVYPGAGTRRVAIATATRMIRAIQTQTQRIVMMTKMIRRMSQILHRNWSISMKHKIRRYRKCFGLDWSAWICVQFIRKWSKWAAMMQ